MSTEAPDGTYDSPGGRAPRGEAADADASAQPAAAAGPPAAGEDSEDRDQPQDAWAARRDLVDHSPRTMNVRDRARFGGGLAGGDQHGVSGGSVTGDVIMGSKTEITQIHQIGFPATPPASGEVPRATLEKLAASFVADDEHFAVLADRLRRDRVLVLSGARFTGRHTAALMLLHRLGALPVRTLDRSTTPATLAERLRQDKDPAAGDTAVTARGYVLSDLAARRDQPLREPHLLAARDRLAEHDAYLVITVGPTVVLEDVPVTGWDPPAADEVLAAHLRVRTDGPTARRLLGLPSVAEFLGRGHQLREVAAFARVLSRHAAGEVAEDAVAQFSLVSLENQVQEWFEQDETTIPLRDKGFLVALAAFDGGPYALTAELSDVLYRFLQETENRARVPEVPVFGTSIRTRLQLARATGYEEDEHTEWGPVSQYKAAYVDERAPLVLLREVWTGHPSARPALIRWLRRLADDGRPLVRTRAASTIAVLARTDLPSAMALIIEPLAASARSRHRLVAVNALTLAHVIDTPNIPRILDGWCRGDDRRLGWVAVRAYALIGPELPDQALAALRGAARRLHAADSGDFDPAMARELAEAGELLLLSSARERILSELLRTAEDDRAVHDLALGSFVSACGRTEGDEPYGRPLILDWYAQAVTGNGPAAHHIPALWRAALHDPRHTREALAVLRRWVLAANRYTGTEWALAALLPALVTTPPEQQRLGHLLRTMPGEDGAPPPPVAARLLTTLPAH
ncbi:hypothetical protein [Streptomyces sp. GC420]|uniref:hypothetical protein n=1 Tax=Streptomyces sp. GC420 TaxID=2697568 RepID=UPI001414EA6A|nr:hypothetical protein [Streptomyces sp. GC420]NBM18978.1 hypothetical protein [Streptomyces sp. GC420]